MADEDARLESLVAKIESDVAHIGSIVAVVRTDLRDLRREMGDDFKAQDGRTETLRKETHDGFRR